MNSNSDFVDDNLDQSGGDSGSKLPFDGNVEIAEVAGDEAAFVDAALGARTEIERSAKVKLKVTPEVAAQIVMINENIQKEVFRLAILKSRTHKRDAYLLVEDVEWAHKRLVAGGSTSLLSMITTTVGGLFSGVGAPMLVAAMTANEVPIQPTQIGWGSGFTFLGLIILALGFISDAKRT